MANRFNRGFCCTQNHILIDASSKVPENNYELIVLILLFILLAASPSLGLESRYFFIIIMAVLGLGGVDKAFGLAR